MDPEEFVHLEEGERIIFKRKYEKYWYIRVLRMVEPGHPIEMTEAYSLDGKYIGSPRTARFLANKKGIDIFEKANESHSICSIGYNSKENKWCGWSHRAIACFGIGDKVYEEGFQISKSNDPSVYQKYIDEAEEKGGIPEEYVPFTMHGYRTIFDEEDMKIAAINFAESVS